MMIPGVRSDGAINMGSYQAYPISANQMMQPGNGEIAVAMKELKEAKEELESVGAKIDLQGNPKPLRFGIAALITLLSWATILFAIMGKVNKADISPLALFLGFGVGTVAYFFLLPLCLYQLMMRCCPMIDYLPQFKASTERVAVCQQRLDDLRQTPYSIANNAGQTVTMGYAYPSFQPNPATSEKAPLLSV